jgi:hypothetical protein
VASVRYAGWGSVMIRRRLVRAASLIILTIGVGHLAITTVVSVPQLRAWLASGLWAAVPFLQAGAPTVESLRSEVAYWSGLGGFAVPVILIALMLWWVDGQGLRVPAWVGWAIAGWSVIGTVLLVPSPWALGVVAGILLVIAAQPNKTPR